MEGESKFVELLGGSPMIKVLDFLLVDREFDYSKKELAENSRISYNTLKSILPYLVGNEMMVKTRRIGKQDMFRLNTGNKYVKDMVMLFDSLIKHSIEDAKTHARAVQMVE